MSDVKTIYLEEYTPPSHHITHTDLTFEIFDEHTLVINRMQITRLDQSVGSIYLNGEGLKLLCVKVDDVKAEGQFTQTDEGIDLVCDKDEFVLQVVTKIYPDENTTLEGLYRSGTILCTQNEPEGFRHITYFIDRPDNMSTFTTTIIAETERYPVLLGNGNLVDQELYAEGRHMAKWEDPFAKPSYLFALVAGDLGVVNDSFTTMSAREIELNIYVDKGNESKCGHAMRSLKNSMKWDEEKYGREYDLDIYNIVAVDSFNMGAMENKGLNIFNSHYVLADEDSATDQNFMGIESVIAHEYFHNWTGNRITCRDWFQLTLKEGLTVFRDQSFSADMNDASVQRISDVKALRERQFVEDAGPTAHPIKPESYIEINNFYTATVYEKGAEVIRMIHTLLGEEKFRAGMDLYFETFDAKAVRTEDFLWAMHSQGGFDLERFSRWYSQERTPTLEVSESYDEEAKEFRLNLKQVIAQTTKGEEQLPYYFPLGFSLLDNSGNKISFELQRENQPLLDRGILIVQEDVETFIFKEVQQKPILSINTGFTAPFKIEHPEADFDFLMRYDSDGFNRYEATQKAAIQALQTFIDKGEVDSTYIESFGAILADNDLGLESKAFMLELPTLSVLMQEQVLIDVAPISEALSVVKKALATRYKESMLAIYTKHHKPQNSELDAQSMGERAIKNAVMSYLISLEDDEINALCLKQYDESVTMTDRIVALDFLENFVPDLAEDRLSHFYERYKEDTLVMNKYLSVLSASEREGTIDRVQALQHDPVYDVKVPNLVRALLGVFARNAVAFHAPTGHGYAFLAEKVIELDTINPQIASGLTAAFRSYDRLNPENKELMKEALEMILSEKEISANVYEIVEKILN
ncbi:MAG: aminopeptidase N [Sulfurimonadaceae bacterium]